MQSGGCSQLWLWAGTVEHLKKLKPDELFFLLSEQVEKGVNKVNQLGDMQKLLGRSGGSLIPAFELGFGRVAQEAKDSGVVISREDIMTLAAAGDQLLTAGRVLGKEGAGNQYSSVKRGRRLRYQV